MREQKTYRIAGNSDSLIREKIRDKKTGEVRGLHLHKHVTKEQEKDLLEIYFGLQKNHYEHPQWGRSRRPKKKKNTRPQSMTRKNEFYLADQHPETQNKTSEGRIDAKWIQKGNL